MLIMLTSNNLAALWTLLVRVCVTESLLGGREMEGERVRRATTSRRLADSSRLPIPRRLASRLRARMPLSIYRPSQFRTLPKGELPAPVASNVPSRMNIQQAGPPDPLRSCATNNSGQSLVLLLGMEQAPFALVVAAADIAPCRTIFAAFMDDRDGTKGECC